MYIKNIFIENMGAIEQFQLLETQLLMPDGLPKILIVIGKNGTGKTTFISSIVDSLYELYNGAYQKQNLTAQRKFFKKNHSSNISIGQKYAFTFIEYQDEEETYQYLDKYQEISLDECSQKTHNLVNLNFKNTSSTTNSKLSTTTTGSTADLYGTFGNDFSHLQTDFYNNSYCYFPCDRFENPHWLNTLKDSVQDIPSKYSFAINLPKDILIRNSLETVKQWIFDILLDSKISIEATLPYLDPAYAQTLQTEISQLAPSLKQYENERLTINTTNTFTKTSVNNIEKILSKIIQKEIYIDFNIRERGYSRIRILDKNTNETILPSLEHLSAGQSTLLSIFTTIISQSDKQDLNKSMMLENIQGIVVIDEIDLHLHLELQHQVLPELISLFPKVQFIITSHSPFFLSGITQNIHEDNYLMVNMPYGNIINKAEKFDEFTEAYNIFDTMTKNHKDTIELLKAELEQSTKTLILTEGKTDAKHLKAAHNNLSPNYPLLESIDIFEYHDEIQMGSKTLHNILNSLKTLPHPRKIIGIFDRDEPDIVKQYGDKPFHDLGNNVYAICLPMINEDLNHISIEYYYSENDRKRTDEQNRRLFDGTEFIKSTPNSYCGNFQIKDINKAGKLVIIDQYVYQKDDLKYEHSVALSKNDFANNIFLKKENFTEINFQNFSLIFDVLNEIIQSN